VLIDLVDTLRCPNPHADSWFVAASDETRGRHITRGTLGCPVCHLRVPIVDGVVCFADAPPVAGVSDRSDEDIMRLAAQLHLIDAPAPILLVGDWSAYTESLLRLLPLTVVVVADAVVASAQDDRVSVLTLPGDVVPLAAGSVRAIAIDAQHATTGLLRESARVLRNVGRLVAPAACVLSETDWRELARDAHVVVAERRQSSSAPVPLRRAPASPLFSA
jgi:hypothetical protein